MIWIEGDPELYERLHTTITQYSEQQVYCCLCSDVDYQPMTFHVVSNNGGLSSVLPPNDPVFAAFDSGLKIVGTRQLVARRLDVFFRDEDVSLDGFNVINIDVQGFELPVLRGLSSQIERFGAIITELN